MKVKVLAIAVAATVITGCNSVQPVSAMSSAPAVATAPAVNPVFTNINDSASRTKRTDYACKMATTPGLKPNFNEMDAFRIEKSLVGVVDLYGDGTLEIVSGIADQYWHPDHWLYAALKQDGKGGYREYSVYSSASDDYPTPANFNFWNARTIIPADLNGDGIDDVVAIQTGRDLTPYSAQPNIVMMSNGKGYDRIELPGKGVYHGGATGDIDGDGDIDIVAVDYDAQAIYSWTNRGNGKFERKQIVKDGNRYVYMQLWDVDGDGRLDIVTDGDHTRSWADVPLTVMWGAGDGTFKSKTTVSGFKGKKGQDYEFVDTDKDGNIEIVVLNSLQGAKKDHWYAGWGIDTVEFTGRTPGKLTNISHNTGNDTDWSWFPFFAACDLKNDGDMDLVIDVYGQGGDFYERKLDKIVFENTNNTFTRHDINATMYYPHSMVDRFQLKEKATNLGATVERYDTKKTVYPINWKIRADNSHHLLDNDVFHVDPRFN